MLGFFFCQICWKKKSCLYCPDVLDTDFILWEILLLREKLKKLQIKKVQCNLF